MKKNKGKQVLIVSYIAFACLVSCIGAALSTPSELTISTDAASDPHVDTSCNSTASSYILRETEGKIGIYTPNNTLIKILDISVLSLPLADRQMLSEGISISTEQDLLNILQDYGG